MIILEKFEFKNDLKRLMSWVDSAHLNIVWASDKFSYPLDELQLESYFKTLNNDETIVFKVITKIEEKKEVVGHAELDINNLQVKISRLLISKKYRGKGFGKQMLVSLIKYIEENLIYNEICLTVFTFNIPAITLYKKIGFEITEIDKSFMKFEKEIWDRQKMILKNNV